MAGDYPEFDGPTIPVRLPPDCPVPVHLSVSLAAAIAAGRRAFWAGAATGCLMTVCVVMTAVLAGWLA